VTTTHNGVPGVTEDWLDPSELPLFLPAKPVPALTEAGREAQARRPADPVSGAAEAVAAGPAGMDWGLVQAMRAQVAEQLAQDGRTGFGPEERELGRSIITGLVAAETRARQSSGQAWSVETELAHAKAVFDAVFGMGRFQPLLDDQSVENIMVVGHDTVVLEHTGGLITEHEPVAESDDDLIAWVAFMGSRSEANARSFSPSNPHMHLQLDDGSRLAAVAWVTPRPTVVIRRHRMQQVSLDDLVAGETISPVAASFLAAGVRAGLSVVVGGPMGGGKTTMVRGLCNEIPPEEMIGTFETERELFLHEMPDKHRVVIPWEARPGSGEVGPNGTQAGEITLAECLNNSFRFNLSRLIVGEIRGSEAWVMVKAMESANGSLSTTHARSAGRVMKKLISCAMELGPSVTSQVAADKLADAIDIIVQMRMETVAAADGQPSRRYRWVSEILHVTPGEGKNGYAETRLFTTDPGSRRLRPGVLPDELRFLAGYGFDLAGYQRELGA